MLVGEFCAVALAESAVVDAAKRVDVMVNMVVDLVLGDMVLVSLSVVA